MRSRIRATAVAFGVIVGISTWVHAGANVQAQDRGFTVSCGPNDAHFQEVRTLVPLDTLELVPQGMSAWKSAFEKSPPDDALTVFVCSSAEVLTDQLRFQELLALVKTNAPTIYDQVTSDLVLGRADALSQQLNSNCRGICAGQWAGLFGKLKSLPAFAAQRNMSAPSPSPERDAVFGVATSVSPYLHRWYQGERTRLIALAFATIYSSDKGNVILRRDAAFGGSYRLQFESPASKEGCRAFAYSGGSPNPLKFGNDVMNMTISPDFTRLTMQNNSIAADKFALTDCFNVDSLVFRRVSKNTNPTLPPTIPSRFTSTGWK